MKKQRAANRAARWTLTFATASHDPRLASALSWAAAAIVLLLPVYFNPLAEGTFEPAKVQFFRYGTLAAALLLVVTRLRGKGRPEAGFRANPLCRVVALYAVTRLVATLFSIDPWISWRGLSDKHGTDTLLVTLFFFFLVARAARTEASRSRIVGALALSSVPVMVYALAQLFGLDPLTWDTDAISPMVSTLGRSNFVGAFLAVVAPFTLARALANPEKAASAIEREPTEFSTLLHARWNLFALLALQSISLFLTQARAGWCALIAGICVVLYLRPSSGGMRRALPIVAVLAVGAVLLVVMNTVNVAALVGRRAQTPIADVGEHRAGTVRSRVAIGRITLELLPRHWALGYGPQTFASVFDDNAPAPLGSVAVVHPHNIVLEHLFAAGLVGLVAFALVIARFYGLAARLLPRVRTSAEQGFLAALVGSCTAYLIQAQFNPDTIVLSVVFWLTLARGTGLQHDIENPACDTRNHV